jgi:malonyl CoA-acyl carrier protein transacylase
MELFPRFPTLCDEASNVVGYDIVTLCREDPDKKLQNTEYAQPVIFFVSALEHLHSNPVPGDFDYYAGHSMGEFNALVAAESIDLLCCLDLVAKRGKAMAKITDGGMLAVQGLTRDQVSALITDNGFAAVYVANHNSDSQVAVAGDRQLLRQFGKHALAAGAKITPLNISGPFHTPLMMPARTEFERALTDVKFGPCSTPVVSSASGELFDSERATEALGAQISSPVEWVATIRALRGHGVTTFDEVNGQTLSKLNYDIRQTHEELP